MSKHSRRAYERLTGKWASVGDILVCNFRHLRASVDIDHYNVKVEVEELRSYREDEAPATGVVLEEGTSDCTILGCAIHKGRKVFVCRSEVVSRNGKEI